MSIFKDSVFILKVKKMQNKEFVYTVFSLKFWKVIAVKKISSKEKALDIWYQINCEIKTNDNINKISNITIINEFNPKNRNFDEINSYLILIKSILEKTPYWVDNSDIFEILNRINKYTSENILEKIILANIKIIDILWELDINHKNPTISKILNFINKNNFSRIINLTWINKEIKKELQEIL